MAGAPPPPHLPTPDLPPDLDVARVYEPAEDTFLLMDALEAEGPALRALRPLVLVELGCGSGAILAFLASLLSPTPQDAPTLLVGTDLNPDALAWTQRTVALNAGKQALAGGWSPGQAAFAVDLLRTDFAAGLRPGLVDVLVFNPPYVVTTSEEVPRPGTRTADLTASWAGGVHGREVVDRLLPQVQYMLAPKGRFYLVVIRDNDPTDILARMRRPEYGGFHEARVVLSRRAGWEGLSILCFTRSSGTSSSDCA